MQDKNQTLINTSKETKMKKEARTMTKTSEILRMLRCSRCLTLVDRSQMRSQSCTFGEVSYSLLHEVDNSNMNILFKCLDDYYGQLGVGCEKVIHNLPKICSFNIIVTDVSCGEEHTIFVQGDGGFVYAMGSNSEGRLGTGN